MFAFWKYDSFPFLLGGEVVDGPNDRGLVQVKGYATPHREGDGFGGGWFDPVFIVSDEEGKRIKTTLVEIREEHREAARSLDLTYRDKLEALLPDRLVDALPKARN